MMTRNTMASLTLLSVTVLLGCGDDPTATTDLGSSYADAGTNESDAGPFSDLGPFDADGGPTPLDLGAADLGSADLGAADMGATDLGPSDLGPPDLGPPDLGPPDMGPSDLGPPDLGPPDLGPPDLGPPDLGPPDMGPEVVAIPACSRADLVIVSFDLVTETLTLFNPTASTITIDSSSSYQLCQGPGRYASLPAPTPVPIAPGATADFVLTGLTQLTFSTTDGTLALYEFGSFGSRDAMLDYVCWGDGAGTPRLDVARRIGSDNSVLWDDGGCVNLGNATELHRIMASDGSAAGHYSTSPQSVECN